MLRPLALVGVLATSAALVTLEACGETLPESGPDADSGIDDTGGGTDPDGPPVDASEGCNPTADFLEPARVEGVGDYIHSFRLTADERTAFYVRNGVLYEASMISAQRAGAPKELFIEFGNPSISGDGRPQNASISRDGTFMFLEAGLRVWFARRQADGGFAAVLIATGYGNPFLDEPRSRVFATKYLEAGAIMNQEIVSSARVGDSIEDAGFKPVGVRAPATSPVPAPDGGGLYFAANVQLRNLDVVYSALPAVADADVPVSVVNGTTVDLPTWISADGCRLYLITRRGSVFGEVYLSRRGR